LADLAKGTPAQVRRDLMILGYSGSPQKGYDVSELIKHIDGFFTTEEVVNVVLVGIGNIGRALLSYFRSGKSHINIIASFDVDENKVDRIINNCHCHHVSKLADFIRENNIKIAILTSPASEAQSVANTMVEGGVKGILNFAPTRLKVPQTVFVEDIDITMNIEKVLYFANGKNA
jgi:redox-sensing transcriptional repressor